MTGRPGAPTKNRKYGGYLNATAAKSTMNEGTLLYIIVM